VVVFWEREIVLPWISWGLAFETLTKPRLRAGANDLGLHPAIVTIP